MPVHLGAEGQERVDAPELGVEELGAAQDRREARRPPDLVRVAHERQIARRGARGLERRGRGVALPLLAQDRRLRRRQGRLQVRAEAQVRHVAPHARRELAEIRVLGEAVAPREVLGAAAVRRRPLDGHEDVDDVVVLPQPHLEDVALVEEGEDVEDAPRVQRRRRVARERGAAVDVRREKVEGQHAEERRAGRVAGRRDPELERAREPARVTSRLKVRAHGERARGRAALGAPAALAVLAPVAEGQGEADDDGRRRAARGAQGRRAVGGGVAVDRGDVDLVGDDDAAARRRLHAPELRRRERQGRDEEAQHIRRWGLPPCLAGGVMKRVGVQVCSIINLLQWLEPGWAHELGVLKKLLKLQL